MRLDIDIRLPSHEIHYTWPQLEIDKQWPRLDITTYGPELTIDSSDAREDLGYGDYRHFAKAAASRGREAALEATARWARDGDRMQRDLQPETIPRLARERTAGDLPELNVQAAPKRRPRIEAAYDYDMVWHVGEAAIVFDVDPPHILWRRGAVQVNAVSRQGCKLDVRG